jgi:type I restriction-modification system DNA methylase subunit
LRNPKLSQRDLNFAVQRTIDRIVFLRICEDRRIEVYGRLQALLNGEHTYRRLYQLFREADQRYNSGLFYFQKEKDRVEPPDDLTPELEINDSVLKNIIRRLYYPDSPYEFSVLPADILGQVYEQFLGKVIRLTEGHQAKVEDKPEVKKAGGVYYTPTYIVDYIVKNSVGKLLENKTPKQAAKLRILDPACGSGSFLIGAYQYLLDWHRDWYSDNDSKKWATGRNPAIYQGPGGEWKLTTAERKRILLQNIFGVDIDSQAVEVTKLSLLLKVLEGESEQTLATQLRFYHERALPDLGRNIKCGNSLIGPDFYEQQEIDFLDEEERYRINVFDWNTEFSEIMKAGGFDAVIGNPSWGAFLTEPELDYLRRKNREIIVRMIDSFMYFVNQTSRKLKVNGFFGMILPDVVLYQVDNENLREFILDEFALHRVLNMGDVFHKVTRPACILIFEHARVKGQTLEAADLSTYAKLQKPIEMKNGSNFVRLAQRDIRQVPGFIFATKTLQPYSIWRKVITVPHQRLKDFVDEDGIQRGVSPDLKEAFIVARATANKARLEPAKLRRVLTGGKQVKRYFIHRPDLLLIYTNRNDDYRKLPNIRAYIDRFRNQITCKEVKQLKHSIYSLHRAREEKIFLKKTKLLGVITEDEIVVAADDQQTFATWSVCLRSARE